MARCSFCGRETELHPAGVPTCVNCANSVRPRTTSVHGQLIQDLLEATAEHDAATATYNQVMWDIPSTIPHPDGVQRISSISRELSIAKERLARAHSRLSNFLDDGAMPEDLK